MSVLYFVYIFVPPSSKEKKKKKRKKKKRNIVQCQRSEKRSKHWNGWIKNAFFFLMRRYKQTWEFSGQIPFPRNRETVILQAHDERSEITWFFSCFKSRWDPSRSRGKLSIAEFRCSAISQSLTWMESRQFSRTIFPMSSSSFLTMRIF